MTPWNLNAGTFRGSRDPDNLIIEFLMQRCRTFFIFRAPEKKFSRHFDLKSDWNLVSSNSERQRYEKYRADGNRVTARFPSSDVNYTEIFLSRRDEINNTSPTNVRKIPRGRSRSSGAPVSLEGPRRAREG